MQVVEAKVLYHDAVNEGEGKVGVYESWAMPWMDLLVQLDDGNWYGPERREDEIQALPLPAGYRWETDGEFSCMEDGGVWWNETSTEGNARLFYGDALLLELQLRIEFIDSGGGGDEGGGGGGGPPPPPSPPGPH